MSSCFVVPVRSHLCAFYIVSSPCAAVLRQVMSTPTETSSGSSSPPPTNAHTHGQTHTQTREHSPRSNKLFSPQMPGTKGHADLLSAALPSRLQPGSRCGSQIYKQINTDKRVARVKASACMDSICTCKHGDEHGACLLFTVDTCTHTHTFIGKNTGSSHGCRTDFHHLNLCLHGHVTHA